MKDILQKNFSGRLCVFLSLVFMFSALLSVHVITAYGAENVTLSKTSMTLEVGKSKTLKVSGTQKAVTWSTSNKSVATVSSNGKVKAKKAGKAIIKAKVDKKTYECKVTVKKASKNLARVGFYVGGSDNSRRVAVQEVSGNKVTFVMAYSGMRESYSEPIVGTVKNGKTTFSYKSDWGNTGTGTIVFHEKYIELKTDGNDFLGTQNQTYKLSWINGNPDISQRY